METLLVTLIYLTLLYTIVGWGRIISCMKMWGQREYWTNYNVIEFAAWLAKALIIVPGLLFGVQIWQLYFVALFTSSLLIWASMRKLLPTLVAFNTLWIAISFIVIVRNLS